MITLGKILCGLGLHDFTEVSDILFDNPEDLRMARLAERSPAPGGYFGPRVSPYCSRCDEPRDKKAQQKVMAEYQGSGLDLRSETSNRDQP